MMADREQRARERRASKPGCLDVEDAVAGVGAAPVAERDPEREQVGRCQERAEHDHDHPGLPRAYEPKRERERGERQQREDEPVEEADEDTLRHAAVHLIAQALGPPAREKRRPGDRDEHQDRQDDEEDDDAPRPVRVGG